MADKAKFWNGIAEKYARDPIGDQAAYETKLDKTRQYFTPDSRVLEFACGTGSTAILHAPYVQHIHAIDISENMIGIAKAKLGPAGVSNIDFEVADIDTFTAPEASYDVIMGHSILHLLDDREAALAKIYRLLKPGGVFVSSTACLGDSLMFRLMTPLFIVMQALGQWPMVKRFTSARLGRDVEAAGFTLVEQWQPAPSKAVFIVARKD